MDTEKIFTNKLSLAVLAVSSCFLWGSAFPAVKLGFIILGITPDATWHKLMFAGYRFFLAGLLILVFAFFSGQSMMLNKKNIKPLIIMALLSSTLQYYFFYIGLSHTSGINASIFNSVLSFFSILLAHFFLENDKIDTNRFAGLIFGFAGIMLVNFSPKLLSINFNILGDGFIILAMFSGAVAFVYLKLVIRQVSIISFTGYQMVLGSILLMLPATVKIGVTPFNFNLQSGLLMVYLAVLSAGAFSLWNMLIKYNPVGKISFYLFLIPIFGTLLSAAFLEGEHITMYTMLALVLVSTGLIIVNTNKKIFRSEKSQNNI